MEKKLTLKEALILSIKKWEFYSNLEGDLSFYNLQKGLIKKIPELERLYAYCGLCEFYLNGNNPDCEKCLLYKENNKLTCDSDGSLYEIWTSSDRQPKNALKILEILKTHLANIESIEKRWKD